VGISQTGGWKRGGYDGGCVVSVVLEEREVEFDLGKVSWGKGERCGIGSRHINLRIWVFSVGYWVTKVKKWRNLRVNVFDVDFWIV
jgi:hypothetical protein